MRTLLLILAAVIGAAAFLLTLAMLCSNDHLDAEHQREMENQADLYQTSYAKK